MTPERWARLKELFQAAEDAGPGERSALVEALDSDDPELAAELRDLLQAPPPPDTETKDVLVRPPARWSPASSVSYSPVPRSIDRYTLLGELGAGGMGRVFLAERSDGAYRQQVALKLLTAGRLADDDARRRFVAERRILARLDHPCIARLIDGGTTEEGQPFLVTERIDGVPIDAYCREQSLGPEAIARLFLGVCEAVEAAHRSLVVHRDLKPGNVLVTADGEPRLLDFGIAKLLDPEPGTDTAFQTRLGHTPLTPRYASPEQIRGEPITVATDVYSLGVLLYELLTGSSPYGEAVSNVPFLAAAICHEEPRAPSTTTRDSAGGFFGRSPPTAGIFSRRRIPSDLDAIVLKALRKEPAQRYPSVAALADDLLRFLDGLPVAARKGSRWYRLSKFSRRHRWPLATALAALVLLAGFVVERERQLRQVERERDKARAVTEFMVDVFSTADPAAEGGEKVTVREILDRGAKRLDRELLGQPEIRAALLETIGRVDHRLGRAGTALPLLARSVELRREHGTPAELAATLRFHGEAAQVSGEIEAAKADYQEALAIAQDSGLELHEQAELQSLLGRLELDRGDFDEASRWLRLSLETGRRARPRDPMQIASALIVLSYVDQLLGAPVAGDPRLEEAEGLLEEVAGEDPVQEGMLLNDAGMVYQLGGQLARSLELLEAALLRLRTALDGDHADIANALNNRGLVEIKLGRYDAAEASLRESLAMWRRLVGDEHNRTALARSNLGAVLLYRERWSEAEPLLREALRTDEALLPPEHPDIAVDHRHLGDALRGQARLQEAETELARALELEEASGGADSTAAAQTRVSLARLRQAQGRLDEAVETAGEAVETFRKAFPEGHSRLALALTLRAELILEGQDAGAADLDTARADLEEALRFQESTLPAEHPDLLRTHELLGALEARRAQTT